jgi:hypothetical protein
MTFLIFSLIPLGERYATLLGRSEIEKFSLQKPKTLRVNGHLGTLWIGPATATVHQKLMGNVPIMESVGKCV